MALNDLVVVVTGGARGMGRAIVHGLLSEGSKVAVLDASWQAAEEFAEELNRHPQALALTASVTDDEALAQAYRATIERFGTVDVIVNNAGMRMRDVEPSTYLRVLDVQPDYWRRMLEVNTLGPVVVTRRFVAPMLEKRAGSIINVSSGSGARGRPGDQPYAASKAALTNLTQSLADELKESNIAVNAVFPAGTRTTGYEEQTRLREQATGVKRTGPPPYKPESIVPVVLFLAEQDARVTGRIFSVVEWNLEHGLGGVETWGAPSGN